MPRCFLSGHLGVLQVLEEFIQTVSFATFPPLPELVRYQRRQTPCEHLREGEWEDMKVRSPSQGRSLRNESSSVRYAHLQEPGVPQGLSGQREKLLHAAGLLPHHQLLGRRRQVQRGYDVGVIRQLCADCFAVQLLHAVHDQLPLALGLGLLHCNTAQGDTSAQVIGEGLIEIEKYHYCVTCDVNGLQGKGLFFIVHQVGLLCLVCHSW